MNPDPVFQILMAYRLAAILRAAIELDVFSALVRGGGVARVAKACGAPERPVRMLLDALAAGSPAVLRKRGAEYRLTPLSRRFLVRGVPGYVGALMPLFGHRSMWEAFYDLPRAVRAGTSVMRRNAHAKGQAFWEDFARATAADAVPKARAMIRLLGRLPRGAKVLDLACGSGGYGATFAERVPGAEVTLLDQPHVLAVTRRLVDAPVRYLPGDLFRTPFGGPYDVVIASHVFHHFDPSECLALARKTARALKPGGRLVIQEFVPDEARARKVQPLVFALTMLVWTRAGDAYSFGQYRGWLRKAGFAEVEQHADALPPADLIIARA
jgi:ubiquinone/menaquinone biosynthesis C-methylase UbiE